MNPSNQNQSCAVPTIVNRVVDFVKSFMNTFRYELDASMTTRLLALKHEVLLDAEPCVQRVFQHALGETHDDSKPSAILAPDTPEDQNKDVQTPPWLASPNYAKRVRSDSISSLTSEEIFPIKKVPLKQRSDVPFSYKDDSSVSSATPPARKHARESPYETEDDSESSYVTKKVAKRHRLDQNGKTFPTQTSAIPGDILQVISSMFTDTSIPQIIHEGIMYRCAKEWSGAIIPGLVCSDIGQFFIKPFNCLYPFEYVPNNKRYIQFNSMKLRAPIVMFRTFSKPLYPQTSLQSFRFTFRDGNPKNYHPANIQMIMKNSFASLKDSTNYWKKERQTKK